MSMNGRERCKGTNDYGRAVMAATGRMTGEDRGRVTYKVCMRGRYLDFIVTELR
jgi:hypothetical protein